MSTILSDLIGQKIIRLKPVDEAGEINYSFCDIPATLEECSDDGTILVSYELFKGSKVLSQMHLSSIYADENWIPLNEIQSGESPLNELIGKKIRRNTPVMINENQSDFSFIENPVVLISATKYHIVVSYKEEKMILDMRYANPKEWDLA